MEKFPLIKFLHTMIRVADPDKTVAFFRLLGLEEVRRHESAQGRFTLIFLAAPYQAGIAELELTYNWGVEKYELGGGYGHVAIAVDDIQRACADVAAKGGKVVYGPAIHGGSTWIAFIEDPDGYKIGVLQRGGRFR